MLQCAETELNWQKHWLSCLYSQCNEAAVMTHRINMFTYNSILLFTYIPPLWSQHKLCGYWPADCLSDNRRSGELGQNTVPRGRLVICGNTCSFLRPSQACKNIVLPSDQLPCFLSCFPPGWDRVFCLPAQVNRKLRLSSINVPNYQTKDDGAAHYYGWPTYAPDTRAKKVFPPSLWKAVFSSGKQVFLITDPCGEGNLSVSGKDHALARIKPVEMIVTLNLASGF